MRWMISILFLLAAACSGGDDDRGTCGGASVGGNTLDGSYCEGLELAFTSVRIKAQDAGDSRFVTIEYLLAEENTTTPLKTLSILLETSAVNVEVNKAIPIFDANGVVRRIDRNNMITLTDQLEPDSQVTFTTFTGEVGSETKGSFGFRFVNGRTLLGDFEATMVDARDTVGE